MAQILATELVQKSLVLSGIVDPKEEIDPDYLKQGKDLLNDTLAFLSMLGATIPYLTVVNIPLVANQHQYTVGNGAYDVNANPIVEVIAGKVYLDGVYQNILQPINVYLNNANDYTSSTGIPYNIYSEYNNDYTILNFYQTPDQAYTAALTVKQNLEQVTLFQQMMTIPQFYVNVINYNLVPFICNAFQMPIPQDVAAMVEKLNKQVEAKAVTPITKSSSDSITSHNDYSFNWDYLDAW